MLIMCVLTGAACFFGWSTYIIFTTFYPVSLGFGHLVIVSISTAFYAVMGLVCITVVYIIIVINDWSRKKRR